MEAKTKRIGAVAGSVLAVSALVGGTIWVANSVNAEPVSIVEQVEPSPEVTRTPTPTSTPTPTPTPEVVVPPAPAPEAPAPAPAPETAPEQPPAPAPAPVEPAPAPEPPPPPPPVLAQCPAGTISQAWEQGVGDTACVPEWCQSTTIDPANPEHAPCVNPFRP